MRVLTVLGTRPEIIRLSRVIEKLDRACTHILLHTGQNFDRTLNEIFFRELAVRSPDHVLDARGSLGEQLSTILVGSERLMVQERPDRLLVLGDTNSSLAAIVAKRLNIPVFHMEAGNRCYDDRVPEEVNRRIIDHCSDVLMPYTERSRQNLLREGIAGERIYVTGNPIYEVLNHYEAYIAASNVLSVLGLEPRQYFLVTMHRAENVDVPQRLTSLISAFHELRARYGVPVVISAHPRMRSRMEAADVASKHDEVRFLDPFGFSDFITLERNAMCVLSDSGTVQEECSIFQVPLVTIRDVTERPETIECGCNCLSGAETAQVLACTARMLTRSSPGVAPREYLVEHVSETVVNLVLGYFWK